jgi:hypothetical protein
VNGNSVPDLPDVRQADPYPFNIADSSAHPHGQILAEPEVDSEAKRETYIAAAGGPEHRDKCGMSIWSEGGSRALQLEAPP